MKNIVCFTCFYFEKFLENWKNEENIDFEMATVVNSCCICLCEKSVHESSYWYKCVPVVNSRILLNIFNRLRSASV